MSHSLHTHANHSFSNHGRLWSTSLCAQTYTPHSDVCGAGGGAAHLYGPWGHTSAPISQCGRGRHDHALGLLSSGPPASLSSNLFPKHPLVVIAAVAASIVPCGAQSPMSRSLLHSQTPCAGRSNCIAWEQMHVEPLLRRNAKCHLTPQCTSTSPAIPNREPSNSSLGFTAARERRSWRG